MAIWARCPLAQCPLRHSDWAQLLPLISFYAHYISDKDDTFLSSLHNQMGRAAIYLHACHVADRVLVLRLAVRP